MRPTISVIIPALNEEENLKPTNVLSAINGRFSDYEFLIFDDGSSDDTGAIADIIGSKGNKELC